MNCNFGSKERLEEMLCNHLVCSVNHQGIQRKLLSEGDISYTDALPLTQSLESVEDDAKKLGGPQACGHCTCSAVKCKFLASE